MDLLIWIWRCLLFLIISTRFFKRLKNRKFVMIGSLLIAVSWQIKNRLNLGPRPPRYPKFIWMVLLVGQGSRQNDSGFLIYENVCLISCANYSSWRQNSKNWWNMKIVISQEQSMNFPRNKIILILCFKDFFQNLSLAWNSAIYHIDPLQTTTYNVTHA